MNELTFKCLGCKHHLSGDSFDCEKKCPRTENGTEQVVCAIQYVNENLEELRKQRKKLLKERSSLKKLLAKRKTKRMLRNWVKGKKPCKW